jgi:hypothetical protein
MEDKRQLFHFKAVLDFLQSSTHSFKGRNAPIFTQVMYRGEAHVPNCGFPFGLAINHTKELWRSGT